MPHLTLSALPADLLIEVYQYLAEVYKPKPRLEGLLYDLHPQDGTLGWVYLTHTCRRLRDVGLGIPFIWANDLCALPNAFDTFLTRARNIPLRMTLQDVVDVERNPPYMDDLRQLLLQTSSLRVDLRFRIDTSWEQRNEHSQTAADKVHKLLDALKGGPLLLMKTLVLAYVSARGVSGADFASSQYRIQAPNLHRATFLGFLVPFDAPNLRILELKHCEGVSVSKLCDLLGTLPRLERLVWDVYWSAFEPADGSDKTSPPKSVELPHLKDFHIIDESADVLRLADALVYPNPSLTTSGAPHRPAYIGFRYPAPWESIAEACTVLRSRLLPARSSRSLTLTIPLTARFLPHVHVLLGESWDASTQSLLDTAYTHYALNLVSSTPPLATLVKGVAAAASSEIHSFYVFGRIPVYPPRDDGFLTEPSDTMRDAFLSLTKVTELHIAYSAEGILPLLMCSDESADDDNEDDDRRVVFPHLETLVVDTRNHGAGWAQGTTPEYEGGQYYEEWQAEHLPMLWWRSFCEMLANRAARGYKLPRLVIRGRTCHRAKLLSGDGFASMYEVVLHIIDTQDFEEWADEVVDERTACGIFEDEVE